MRRVAPSEPPHRPHSVSMKRAPAAAAQPHRRETQHRDERERAGAKKSRHARHDAESPLPRSSAAVNRAGDDRQRRVDPGAFARFFEDFARWGLTPLTAATAGGCGGERAERPPDRDDGNRDDRERAGDERHRIDVQRQRRRADGIDPPRAQAEHDQRAVRNRARDADDAADTCEERAPRPRTACESRRDPDRAPAAARPPASRCSTPSLKNNPASSSAETTRKVLK